MGEKEKAKPKFNLEDLKVQSFVTTLGNADKLRLKAGDATWTDATAGCCRTTNLWESCLYNSCVIACTTIFDCGSLFSTCPCGGGGGGGDTGCFGSFMY